MFWAATNITSKSPARIDGACGPVVVRLSVLGIEAIVGVMIKKRGGGA